jgi:tRNA modification GTPase
VAELREGLVHLEALLAHHVDFPEEDDAPVPIERVVEDAATMCGEIDAMLATAPEGELLREGALTVFAGRPNAGKSSLYNALLGQDRAIVTDEPGTTRDALEATVQIGGYPFRLVDTAGLRGDAGRIEQLGIEVARRYLASANLVLLCVPADEELSAEDLAFLRDERAAPVLLVETMADRRDAAEPFGDGQAGVLPEGIAGRVSVSAVSGAGLDEVKGLLPALVFRSLVGVGEDAPVLTRRRHARALRAAREEVGAFVTALERGLPAEVAATHLRSAETALEELVGLVSVDDVLEVVFREFCIGK